MSREQEFLDRIRASFRLVEDDEAWVEWVAGRIDGDAVVVLYRWISHVRGRFETHPVDARRWVLDDYGREVFSDSAASLDDLASEAILEIQEPDGPGRHFDVPWADGLVPDPAAVRWHGSAVEQATAVALAQHTRPRVLVCNGGSSSGKSSLTRALQLVLPGVWLRFSVDTLIDACPPSLLAPDGLDLAPDGEVHVGAAFTEVEERWMAGIARMAELGAQVLVEDGFVSGPAAQERWRRALQHVPVGWVGVRCDPGVAADRERMRGDRGEGMARLQAESVHVGIDYDLEVDTTAREPAEVADVVLQHWFR
jgi:chloramphenicol 3-O phosphotransferase